MNPKICIIGLGYVGLPLAVEFGKKFETIGFDINENRIKELENKWDKTLEIAAEGLISAKNLTFTFNYEKLSSCNVYIVTVPTPVDEYKKPDLTPIEKASHLISKVLNKGDYVIYESTVYPGCTEEICVPILEKGSNLKLNRGFFVGYSPERINPGDKQHTLTKIRKVTSGSNPDASKFVNDLYSNIIEAGTFMASSIRVAEAAKVIENTQRDVNIALINELAILFNKLEIDTLEVLEAAGTKWNFLPFRPGLVGGHCIGVDPYYLTHKAESIGYHPQIILAGRRLNDDMGRYVAGRLVKKMVQKDISLPSAKILILGLTFKENCPDLRNTRVIDIREELLEYGLTVDVFDPWVKSEESQYEYNFRVIPEPEQHSYDGIVLAVAHTHFKELGIEKIRAFLKPNHVLFDLKSIFPRNEVDLRL